MKKRVYSILKLCVPYMLTTLLPIVLMILLCNAMNNVYKQKVINDRQKEIENSVQLFAEKADTLETIAHTIVNSDFVRSYLLSGLEGEGYSVINDFSTKEFLYNFVVLDYVADIYIVDSKCQRIITPYTVCDNGLDYFRYSYQPLNNTAAEYMDRVNQRMGEFGYFASERICLRGNNREIIEYHMPLYIVESRMAHGQLILALDVDKLFAEFSSLIDDGIGICICDKNDSLLYSSWNELSDSLEERDYENMTVHAFQLDNCGLNVEVIVPATVYNQRDAMRFIWGLLVAVAVVLSVLFSIYFTIKQYKEIKSLLGLFVKKEEVNDLYLEEEGVGEYGLVRQYICNIIDENSKYRESISDALKVSKVNFLNKLLRKGYENPDEIANAVKKIELDISSNKYIVICIRYLDSNYRRKIAGEFWVKDFVTCIFKRICPLKNEIFDSAARETVCILDVNDSETINETINNLISRLNVEALYLYDIKAEIGVGSVVSSLYEVYESYERAQMVITYNNRIGKQVLFYSELEKIDDLYYCPREFEQKMQNYLLTGDVDAARQMIRTIYEKNFLEEQVYPSIQAANMLQVRIQNCLLATAEKGKFSDEKLQWQIDNNNSMKAFFDRAESFIEIFANNVLAKKKNQQEHLAASVLDYIEDNYCDSSLSLTSIAVVFELSEPYISNLFKEVTGENISSIIEQKRIDKACELMTNTNMRIVDITESIGYASDTSFRRAFKRLKGISPSEYKILANEKENTKNK